MGQVILLIEVAWRRMIEAAQARFAETGECAHPEEVILDTMKEAGDHGYRKCLACGTVLVPALR